MTERRPQVLVRLPPDVYEQLEPQATRAERSLAAHVLYVLRIWLSLPADERAALQRRYDG